MTTTVDGDDLVRVQGELDLVTADAVGRRLHAAIDSSTCRRVRLDLHQVRFIDASGLSVLLGAAAYARARQCRWDVVGADPQVRRIIDITGTGQALGIV
ncbi:STAS domain-containing protein [Catellatospora sp. TT07R-123]|uniref:STAS domain-containing protein n=1 Tax=Catellatospora sp. TT07R-123 TaxID=2733863 RepID=UPI001BB3A168|nr:STAS domain-containing protein [Catellatospora sp. TT07R-123]